jgi:hypothetical protein
MNSFQLFGIALVTIFILLSVTNIIRYRGRPRVTFLWLLVWILSGIAIADPSIAVVAARAVGVGRGADLVFYFNVLMTLMGFFVVYLRQRKLDRHITVLVRELALTRGNAESLSNRPIPASLEGGKENRA